MIERSPLFNIIQQALKFKYKIVEPIPRERIINKNGTFSGTFGQVVNQEADITMFHFLITYERYLATDFTSVYMIQPIKFLTKDGEASITWEAIGKPYSNNEWLTIFASIIIVGLILTPIVNYDNDKYEIKKKWSMNKSFWFVFATITNQGIDLRLIKGKSSRLLIGIWSLSALVLVSIYTGRLTSFLTKSVQEEIPSTFQQLANSVEKGEYTCGAYDNRAIYTYITSSNTETATVLSDHMKHNNYFFDSDDNDTIIEKLQKGRFAFISTKSDLKYYLNHLEGRWFLSQDSLVSFSGGLVVRRGFVYKSDIDKIISRLYEVGIIEKLYKNRSLVMNEVQSEDVEPLNTENFLGAFVLLFGGYMVALCLLFTEILFCNGVFSFKYLSVRQKYFSSKKSMKIFWSDK